MNRPTPDLSRPHLPPLELEKWEADFQKFATEDAEDPPPPDYALFTGSSSIVFWKDLASDFPERVVRNRGFGGSQLREVLALADRIIGKTRPASIVVYGGSHDLRKGSTPEDAAETWRRIVGRFRELLPGVEVYFLSLKPSLKKWESIELDFRLNEIVAKMCESETGMTYVDVTTPILAEGRPPPAKYFIEDRNHPSRLSYALYTQILKPYLVPEAG